MLQYPNLIIHVKQFTMNTTTHQMNPQAKRENKKLSTTVNTLHFHQLITVTSISKPLRIELGNICANMQIQPNPIQMIWHT